MTREWQGDGVADISFCGTWLSNEFIEDNKKLLVEKLNPISYNINKVIKSCATAWVTTLITVIDKCSKFQVLCGFVVIKC